MKNRLIIKLIILPAMILSLLSGIAPANATYTDEPEAPMISEEIIIDPDIYDTDEETDITVPIIEEYAEIEPVPVNNEDPIVHSVLQDPVEQFIIRLYDLVLQRQPDPGGLEGWVNYLKSGEYTGARVAYGFFFSQEMLDRNLPPDQYIEILYNTFLNRPSDPPGKQGWLDFLHSGYSREDIFAGFANSNEFGDLCAQAGIIRGTYYPPPGAAIRVFVTRMYRTTLLREPDEYGLNGWTQLLLSGTTGVSVAYGFVFSREMNDRNLTNGQFVDILYTAFLGRPADVPGRTFWVGRLDDGYPRENIFAGFANSTEFGDLCAESGIIRGTYIPPAGGMAHIFVNRLYRNFNVTPNPAHLNNLVNSLSRGLPATAVAYNVIFSSQVTAQNLSNNEFVEALYSSLYGRPAYPNELSAMTGLLLSGVTRFSLFESFINNIEFDQTCRYFGIVRGRAIDPSRPMIALTFDDGPTMFTNQLIDVFVRQNASATFYILGAYGLASNHGTIQRAFNMGIEIGNHTWSHPYLTSLSVNEIRNEIVSLNNTINAITGMPPATLRPGYGVLNQNVINVAAEQGMPIILWTLMGEQYSYDATAVANHVINTARSGDIVLLHDGHADAAPAAERIIVELSARGFQFVTVSELLFYSNTPPAPGQVIGSGY